MTSRANRELRQADAGRPKVGAADPATRRRMLDAALSQPSKATGVAPRPARKPLPGGPVRSTYDQLRMRGQDTDAEVRKRDK